MDAKDQLNRYRGLYCSVIGTVFFGVPFRGTSDSLSQGEILERAAAVHGCSTVYRENYRILKRDDEHMQELLNRYLRATWDDSLPPRTLCIWERKRTDVGALLGKENKVGLALGKRPKVS